jgi:DNA anti-recombination protein RmuC
MWGCFRAYQTGSEDLEKAAEALAEQLKDDLGRFGTVARKARNAIANSSQKLRQLTAANSPTMGSVSLVELTELCNTILGHCQSFEESIQSNEQDARAIRERIARAQIASRDVV